MNTSLLVRRVVPIAIILIMICCFLVETFARPLNNLIVEQSQGSVDLMRDFTYVSFGSLSPLSSNAAADDAIADQADTEGEVPETDPADAE